MDPVSTALHEVHRAFSTLEGGAVADYIPKLADADPHAFGIAMCSMAGRCYQAGDAQKEFTVQSVSKPFVYALALSDLGPDGVLLRVGSEPSGEAFNAISLERTTGRPVNPLVNAGAIATTALVVAASPAERRERIRAWLSLFAGRELTVDEEVRVSEAATGDRNRALAYLMYSAGSLEEDPLSATDTYFYQCSVRVTAVDLAVMAATLANGGLNPVSGVRVVKEPVAVRTLGIMAMCGMYDRAGQWMLDVGLPAKSGVAGGLIAASPGRFGVATFSPPLDAEGNSVRGVAAMTAMSDQADLHLMHAPAKLTATITGTEVLDLPTGSVLVVSVQGVLEFTEAEQVLKAVWEARPAAPGWVVLDMTGVTAIESAPAAMLGALAAELDELGNRVVVAAQQPFLDAYEGNAAPWRAFATRAAALAWCEQAPEPPADGR
jgi:glutaminase